MAELKPWQQIETLVEERATWSDEQVLAELELLAPLPDEDDPVWAESAAWDHANLYVAHTDLASVRRLEAAIPLLFERASYGDPGEIMRTLRHCMERIVSPDWPKLTRMSIKAAQSPHKGSRLWALSQLGILRDLDSMETLIGALTDEAPLVRLEARLALEMLCQKNSTCRQPSIRALEKVVELNQHRADAVDLHRTIEAISEMDTSQSADLT